MATAGAQPLRLGSEAAACAAGAGAGAVALAAPGVADTATLSPLMSVAAADEFVDPGPVVVTEMPGPAPSRGPSASHHRDTDAKVAWAPCQITTEHSEQGQQRVLTWSQRQVEERAHRHWRAGWRLGCRYCSTSQGRVSWRIQFVLQSGHARATTPALHAHTGACQTTPHLQGIWTSIATHSIL